MEISDGGSEKPAKKPEFLIMDSTFSGIPLRRIVTTKDVM